jgi:glycosyltransferase involved in cell wall biosynthesis
MNDKISIIIPVYNVEKYIRRCLDSVVNQTYNNLEILLIDDGSTDDSGTICDEYEKRDNRIQVWHLANGGVGAARNYGLKKYTGQYCLFIDSDDLVVPTYVEKLYEASCRFHTGITACGAYNCPEKDAGQEWTVKDSEPVYIQLDVHFDYTKEYARTVVWGVLFERSAISGISFSEDLYVGEDTLFFATVLKHCGNMCFLDSELYCWIGYENSACHGKFDEKKYTEAISWARVSSLYRHFPRRLRRSIDARQGQVCINCIKKMKLYGDFNDAQYTYLLKTARQNMGNYLLSNMCFSVKVRHLVFCIMPKVYLFLYVRIKKGLQM